ERPIKFHTSFIDACEIVQRLGNHRMRGRMNLLQQVKGLLERLLGLLRIALVQVEGAQIRESAGGPGMRFVEGLLIDFQRFAKAGESPFPKPQMVLVTAEIVPAQRYFGMGTREDFLRDSERLLLIPYCLSVVTARTIDAGEIV